MALNIKTASGYSQSSVLFTGSDEVAYICGNTLVLNHLVVGSQRLLRGTSFGIQAFAVNSKHGLVAFAEKGPSPAIHVYSSFEMKQLATITLEYELGYSALAFSADGERLAICGEEPDAQLVIYMWRQSSVLVSGPVPPGVGPVRHISFHPYDADRVATSSPSQVAAGGLGNGLGRGGACVWRVERMWEKHVLRCTQVQIPPATRVSAGNNSTSAQGEEEESVTTHCWYPAGLYVGTSAGRVVALDAHTLQPHRPVSPAPPSSRGMGSAGLGPTAASEGLGSPALSASPHLPPGVPQAFPPAATDADAATEPSPDAAADTSSAADASVLDAACHGPVASLAVNRDLLVVGGAECVRWFTHTTHAAAPQQYHTEDLGPGTHAVCVDVGGMDAHSIIAGVSDGRVLLYTIEPLPVGFWPGTPAHPQIAWEEQPSMSGELGGAGEVQSVGSRVPVPQPPGVSIVVEAPVGPVVAMAPHPSRHNSLALSVGADGVLRVWSGAAGRVVARRAFSAALSCLAVAPVGASPIAAVGSEGGVLRLLWLGGLQDPETGQIVGGEAGAQELQVVWRQRLQAGPLHHATFSPDGTMLAVAGRNGNVWFLSLDVTGTALVLGHVHVADTITGLMWPEVHDAEECVMVTLASGGAVCVGMPMALHAASRPTGSADLELHSHEAPTKVVRLEAPLSSPIGIPGDKYGEMLGVGADRLLHKLSLPVDAQAWGGAKGRMLKSTVRMAVHARAEGVLSVSPSQQLLVSGAADGLVATHTLSLMTIGTLPPSESAAGALLSRGVSPVPPPGGHMGSVDGASNSAGSTEEGSVAGTRASSLAAFAGGARMGLHDATAGGVSAVTFDHSSRYVLSAGADGSVFVYETRGTGHLTRDEGEALMYGRAAQAPKVAPAVLAARGDVDAWDDPAEATAAEVHRAAGSSGARVPGGRGGSAIGAARSGASQAYSSVSDASRMAAQLEELRAALLQCVAANDAAPGLEKVEQADFLINRALAAELAAAADARVAEARAHVRRAQLELEVVADRVKHTCREDMAEVGARVCGIRAPTLTVPNFPLTKQPARAAKLLEKLSFLRRVETVERRGQLGVAAGLTVGFAGDPSQSSGLGPESSSLSVGGTSGRPPALSTDSLGVTGAGGTGSLVPPTPGGAYDEEHGDELASPGGLSGGAAAGMDGLLYADSELHCRGRKVTQLHLLTEMARKVQAAFNEDWARVAKQKKADADRIHDFNSRLEEVCRDLANMGAAHPPLEELRFVVPWPEDMGAVLKVKDEEVGVERYVSAEARVAAERAGGAGAGAGAGGAAGEAGAAERALRAMMGGTLASRQDDEEQWVLIKPEWMDGNPKLFNEEQQKEVREFQARERALAEEKAKRITVLEQELRTVRAGAEEVAGRFDEVLGALAARRAVAVAEVAALESRMLGLASASDVVLAASDAVEASALNKLGTSKEHQARLGSELAERASLLAQAEARIAELTAEEKALDRNFKKEFNDAEHHYSRLLHLYRTRTAGATSPHHQGAPGHDAGRERLNRQASRMSDSNHSFTSHGTGIGGRSRAARVSLTSGSAAAAAAAAVAAVRAEGSIHPGATEVAMGAAAGGSTGVPVQVPGSPLAAAMRHPAFADHAAGALCAWPELPPAAAALVPSSLREHGALPEGVVEDPEEMGEGWRPEGVDHELWARFDSYRGARVRLEAELRQLGAQVAVLQKEVPELTAAEAAEGDAADAAMAEVQALRAARRAALYDVELQLRLKAGQVEAIETLDPDATDAQRATFVGAGVGPGAALMARSVVEGTNAVVRQKGTKNVEILTAIKDFKKGIYRLQWEHSRCDMQVSDLTERVRELQLLHVTRDMQAVFKEGGAAAAAAAAGSSAAAAQAEFASLEALLRQRERLHAKAVADKARALRKLVTRVTSRAGQNAEVGGHLTGLGKVLEEQQRLRASMGSADEAATRRMRSLVTHKKLKEIALAQADEVRALAAELDRCRLRTYPTFVESAPPPLPADTRVTPHTKLPGLGVSGQGFGGGTKGDMNGPGSPGASVSPQRLPRGGVMAGSRGSRASLRSGGNSLARGAPELLPLQRSHPNISLGIGAGQ